MQTGPDSLLVISPFDQSDPKLIASVCRAGAIGVLDLGHDRAAALEALAELRALWAGPFGVRLPDGAAFAPADLPVDIALVVLPATEPLKRWAKFRILVQVTTIAEARAAAAAGADGLIAKGHESGGRVGDDSSFILFQRIAAELSLPTWVQGGIGLFSAPAAIAGGAAGVVLDSQFSLVRESSLTDEIKAVVSTMDGSQTVVFRGYRVFVRPGLDPAAIAGAADIAGQLGAASLERTLLPAGQDTAFASYLADRFQTAGGVVRALRESIAGAVRGARNVRSLGPGSRFATDLGIKYPIVQGPMTRVSDQPAFAEAVATAGGLPFLALALMRGPEVKTLLAETAHRLEGRAWGVGILGFVPPELREEQLAAIAEIRPPVAIIAGGRPAQARSLEEGGTETFLHVPSPGLLDLFLKQGARRFVFEGRECGGHVGPRTSLVLWESQMQRLMQFPAPQELSVLFAGGIHDARSAAMVSALAEPLAARGARIGVLMGTAYLFTEEAVSTGAIQAAFQEMAVECGETVLLETAPGHATRCAETPYAVAFQNERQRLEASGLPVQEMWEALEGLNLGRLRLAAKGIKREGEKLLKVDAETQRSEGMIMLGQVATLRDRLCKIEDLHRDVSEGAGEFLARVEVPEHAEPVKIRVGDVAIVGMAAILPKSPDLQSYWANIVNGVNCITEVPSDRWSPDIYYDPNSTNGENTPSKWGGFLDPVAFDPLSFGIPPLSLAAIEPVQLLALEVSRRALADAGYLERDFDRERTSVIFGAEAGADLSSAHSFRALWRQYVGAIPPELDAVLPRLTEDSFPGMLSNVISGRIANRLDLGGANYTVDAACASSLAAVDLACKDLITGSSDIVLCGGADLHNGIVDYLMFSSVHALSPSGQCKTFDASADGISLGEGVAAIVLKRLEDAQRDGDRIYAVIEAVGASSDGRSLGLTAPRLEGQARALDRAYSRAGVSPAEVELIEAHGTGTVVGDRTELETLSQIFNGAGAAPGTVALGSVKSQIGHTKTTAGVAGVIKAALSIYNRVLPPTVNIETPNPGWDRTSPFTLSATARPWPSANRKAGVSAFGFGGTNFHVVLSGQESSPATGSGIERWPSELFLFRGRDRAEAAKAVDGLSSFLAANDSWSLKDLAWTVSQGDGQVQIAIVANDVSDLRAKLAIAHAGNTDPAGVFFRPESPPASQGKLAFLFPGQGSQRVNMLRDLFIAFPDLQQHLSGGKRWSDLIFPPTPWSTEEKTAQREALTDTRAAQPALGLTSLAVADLLSRLGLKPDMVAGHSYGELAALSFAGAISEGDLLPLSEKRGQCIVEATRGFADAGAMAAVSAAAATVAPLISGLQDLVIANENSPQQSVISGPTAAVEEAVDRLKSAGISSQMLPVACAFHSPVVAGASETFASELKQVEFLHPDISVYSNTTTSLYPSDADEIRSLLAGHVSQPVHFSAEIEAMYAAGARTFVESGPGRVLTGLVSAILGDRPHHAIACDIPGYHGITSLLLALGQLATSGLEIDIAPLFAGRHSVVVDLTTTIVAGPASTSWWVNGQRAWPVSGEAPSYAMVPVTSPIVSAASFAAPQVAGGDRETVVLEYLQSVREIVDTQRRVMLSYLGEADTGPMVLERAQALPAARPERREIDVQALPAPIPVVRGENVEGILLAVIEERTGYPTHMLGLDLDLEADLSIDSIKRVEILGLLAEKLGLRGDDSSDELPEDLVRTKTIRGIVEALKAVLASAHGDEPAAIEAGRSAPMALLDSAAEAADEDSFSQAKAPDRYVLGLSLSPLEKNGDCGLKDARVQIAGGDKATRAALTKSFGKLGATVEPSKATGTAAPVEVLLDLTPLHETTGELSFDLFERVRSALASGTRRVLVVTPVTGVTPSLNGFSEVRRSGGAAGLLKTFAKEWGDSRLQVLHLEPSESPASLAARVTDELASADAEAEVSYIDGIRLVPRAVSRDLSGGGPIDLDESSVVLLIGGGRGITARIAREMAARFHLNIELAGRTDLPASEEDPDLLAARDAAALRRALIARGVEKPAAIEAECARILAVRETRVTIAALEAAGARVVYHRMDVRDEAACAAVIADIYSRHGRLNGVVYGAGVLDDKLAVDKTRESFARVFDTKVIGALNLAHNLRDDTRFVAFFASISGVYGNRGQSDYAAANDFLDKLALAMNLRHPGRIVSIDWGPWAQDGMVSPEVARGFAARGIELIDPDAGARAFIDEILCGDPEDAQVILMPGNPGAFS